MAQILTYADFLVRIKNEAQINDTSADSLILALTNECLQEIASNTEDLRDFDTDITNNTIGNVNYVDITTNQLYYAKISQVWYLKVSGSAIVGRYDLTELRGMIGPAPYTGYPNAYSLIQATAGSVPSFKLNFYPIGSGKVNDQIQVLGTSVRYIVNDATVMPYLSVLPMLTRSILQRLQIYRNKPLEQVKAWDSQIQRAASGASAGTKEMGNSENLNSKS